MHECIGPIILVHMYNSSSSSNSIYLYTKINITFYNVFYCFSNSLQVWVPGLFNDHP